MEENLMPDDYAGHIAVKDALKSVPTMLATAEHEYTRYGYKQLIDSGAVDILQPDVCTQPRSRVLSFLRLLCLVRNMNCSDLAAATITDHVARRDHRSTQGYRHGICQQHPSGASRLLCIQLPRRHSISKLSDERIRYSGARQDRWLLWWSVLRGTAA